MSAGQLGWSAVAGSSDLEVIVATTDSFGVGSIFISGERVGGGVG